MRLLPTVVANPNNPMGNNHQGRLRQSRVGAKYLATFILATGSVLLMDIWVVLVLDQKQTQDHRFAAHNEVVAGMPSIRATKSRLQRKDASKDNTYAKKNDFLTNDSRFSPQYHILFSTGCTPFQDWQSYVFFYHVWKSGQQGHVTRIASGCNHKQTAELKQLHQEQVVVGMGQERFHLHLTPEFNTIMGKGKTYRFFNKPFGLRHYMEHGLGFPNPSTPFASNDTIFIVLDPDQLILRPLVDDYSDEAELWRTDPTYLKIAAGQPMAQEYGFTARQFIHLINMTYILGSPTAESGARYWTEDLVNKHYVVGPPYIAVGSDMYNIVYHWSQFMPAIYNLTNGAFLAEMWGYSTAAAHLNLPHLQAKSFMISNAIVNDGEGWPLIDNDTVSSTAMCQLDFAPQPHVLHFCQKYHVGPHYFYKYQLPSDPRNPGRRFFSCEHPLFQEPEPNLFDLYNDTLEPDGTWHDLRNKKIRKRHSYALCQLIPRLNQAALYFKEQHCDKNANVNKNFLFPRAKALPRKQAIQ